MGECREEKGKRGGWVAVGERGSGGREREGNRRGGNEERGEGGWRQGLREENGKGNG